MTLGLSPIKAVLFDLDGTLVHSALDFMQIRKDIACPAECDILEYLTRLNESDRNKAEAIIQRHELEDAQNVECIPGVEQTLAGLVEQGIRTAIITRNSREATFVKLAKLNLSIEHVLTREDAPAKPHPGALLHFSNLWQIQPRECVYVGDYKYDLQAARNANMHGGLYCEQGLANLPDYADQADFIFESFMSFEDQLLKYLNGKAPQRM